MPKPFHYWLPDWIKSDLKKRNCSKCEAKYSKTDITAVGIRQISPPHECAMYIEHVCPSCGYRALTTFGREKERSLESMCYSILDSIKKKKLMDTSKTLRKRKEGVMTDKEVKEFLNVVRNSACHDDFCKEIGVNPVRPKDDSDKDDSS